MKKSLIFIFLMCVLVAPVISKPPIDADTRTYESYQQWKYEQELKAHREMEEREANQGYEDRGYEDQPRGKGNPLFKPREVEGGYEPEDDYSSESEADRILRETEEFLEMIRR